MAIFQMNYHLFFQIFRKWPYFKLCHGSTQIRFSEKFRLSISGRPSSSCTDTWEVCSEFAYIFVCLFLYLYQSWLHGNQYSCHGNQYSCHGNQYSCHGNQCICHGNQCSCHGNQSNCWLPVQNCLGNLLT